MKNLGGFEMFQPPEWDPEDIEEELKKCVPHFVDGNLPASEQMKQIAEIKTSPIEEVRRKYLEPLFAKLGGRG